MRLYCTFVQFKDLIAIPIFIWLALHSEVEYNVLSLLFSIGCLIDAIFVSVTWCYDIPWSVASLKDALGAFGMMGFTIMLAYSTKKKDCPSNMVYFFVLAAVVDILSIVSIVTPWNIYLWELI